MAYNKYTWTASSLLSGRRFNYLETQWDEIKSDADAYFHDSRYYNRTTADTTFFSTSFYTGFDAEKLDGLAYADVVSASLPVGSIAIWSGSVATIPAKWDICDGTNYGGVVSPDLRDRFIVGAGGTYDPGDTGGPANYNDNIVPAMTLTIGAHALTTAELPSHTHTYSEYCPNNTIADDQTYNGQSANGSRSTAISEQAVGGGTHGHTGSTITFDGYDSRPPYYALCYIIKYE